MPPFLLLTYNILVNMFILQLICEEFSSKIIEIFLKMKSGRVFLRLASRKRVLSLSKKSSALISSEFVTDPNLSPYNFQQKRSLATPASKKNPTTVKLSTFNHPVALGKSNVMSSVFGETPICTTPLHKKIFTKILDHAAAFPSRPALMMAEKPSERVTYVELHRQTYGLSSFLALRGFEHMDVCCTVLPNCLESVPAYLAAMMIGGVSMAADQDCTAALTSIHLQVIVCVTSSASETLPEGVVRWTEAIESPTVICDNHIYDFNDPAFIQYHSGLPEEQNGIVMSHKSISTMLDINTEYFNKYVYKRMFYDSKEGKFEPRDEYAILSMPFHHIFGFAQLSRALIEGSSGLIMTNLDPASFLQTIQDYKPKIMAILPEFAEFLLHDQMTDEYDLNSLEVVVIGGAPFDRKFLDEFLAKFRHIVSPETGDTLPFNARGEICLRSPTLMNGYMNNPEATAKAIDTDGWFHTGDIGMLERNGETLILDHTEFPPSQEEEFTEILTARQGGRLG
ncbi:AMP-binding enzyme [Necator americanus]|uniref:AMP-binding enzyme n=1 Tax=Necator americanus TaxID=51031 RepID=W2TXY9_NECAM|nr:AMP-binding enzyme [Necator americanus]ETN86930.1 AMP-binding enzyme [Necator americanus]